LNGPCTDEGTEKVLVSVTGFAPDPENFCGPKTVIIGSSVEVAAVLTRGLVASGAGVPVGVAVVGLGVLVGVAVGALLLAVGVGVVIRVGVTVGVLVADPVAVTAAVGVGVGVFAPVGLLWAAVLGVVSAKPTMRLSVRLSKEPTLDPRIAPSPTR
jgi:hypothetical protein